MDRRTAIVMAGLVASLPSLAFGAVRPFVPAVGPRSRVLFANDLSGDIDGLFATVAVEEKKIRTNPAARTTDLLKTVFGK